MGTPPHSPYPPDLAEDEDAAEAEFGDLVEVVVEHADWANRRAPGLQARRAELRQCRLTGAKLGEAALTDVTFEPWTDVLENAALFATALGIEIVD